MTELTGWPSRRLESLHNQVIYKLKIICSRKQFATENNLQPEAFLIRQGISVILDSAK